MTASFNLDEVRFAENTGTVVVVTQDAVTGTVLMVANADREALEYTLETGEMHYRSRSRGLWKKGVTSGNIQRVVSLALDCDGDAVLARVVASGPACHTGEVSCFPHPSGSSAFTALAGTIRERRKQLDDAAQSDAPANGSAGPRGSLSYTTRLLADRNLRLKKIGEEAAEFLTACADSEPGRAAEEAADLIYHVAVALEAVESSLDAVGVTLFERSQRARGIDHRGLIEGRGPSASIIAD